jgi:thiamine pyrophosphokinase
MSVEFVESDVPVTLVGGAPLDRAVLDESMALAPRLVAADSGAAALLAAGHLPEAVFGDMDSLAPADAARLEGRVRRIAEQDSTDFDKALRHIRAPLVLAVGFTGARLDHELAVYNVLVRARPGAAVVVGSHDIAFHAPARLRLDLPAGARLSLFPLAPVTGRSEGLEWPIGGIAFAPDGRVGTSNRATGPVALALDGPGMLAILPRAHLGAVTAALSNSAR